MRYIECLHNIGGGETNKIAHRRFCTLTFPFLDGIGYRVMERHSPLVSAREARGDQATDAQRSLERHNNPAQKLVMCSQADSKVKVQIRRSIGFHRINRILHFLTMLPDQCNLFIGSTY